MFRKIIQSQNQSTHQPSSQSRPGRGNMPDNIRISGIAGAIATIIFVVGTLIAILLSEVVHILDGWLAVIIVVLYLVREFVSALSPSTVSELAHIAGGLIGGLFGFLFSAQEKKTSVPSPRTPAPTRDLDPPEKKE